MKFFGFFRFNFSFDIEFLFDSLSSKFIPSMSFFFLSSNIFPYLLMTDAVIEIFLFTLEFVEELLSKIYMFRLQSLYFNLSSEFTNNELGYVPSVFSEIRHVFRIMARKWVKTRSENALKSFADWKSSKTNCKLIQWTSQRRSWECKI